MGNIIIKEDVTPKSVPVNLVEEAVVLPGKPLTYDDLTPEQIEELQRPAIEAAETANKAAETANIAAKNADTAAETVNIAAKNADTAAETADTATKTANIAAKNADTAAETANEAAKTANKAAKNADTAAETANIAAKTANIAAKNADTATETADIAAKNADTAAETANEAADKANQAAENIATYKENGFYISHIFLEATDLRYIGFKEIENDKTCYLLTMGRCLKFSLDTYEVFWDVKLEGYGTRWHNSAEQLRVIDDTVYIICTKYNDINSGIWLIKLNDENGAFISEELIPIPVMYLYNTFKNREVLITKDYIYGLDSVNKQILRCSIGDKSVEIIDSIDSAVSFSVLGNRWITLPDASVKYALVWISAKNHIKIVDEDNNLYSIKLTFSNNAQMISYQDTYLHNINFKILYISLIIINKGSNRYSIHLTDGGDNSYSAEDINVRNTYQNFPYTTELYGNSMTTPDTIVSTNILSVTNEGFYRPITNKAYIFMSNDPDILLASNLSISRTGVRRQIEIINPI